jgi:hypothetical protein
MANDTLVVIANQYDREADALADFGELRTLYDKEEIGLVVVAATNVETMVEATTKRAKNRAKAPLQADIDAMKKELATV